MADHLDAPGLKSPGMDPAIDITDIYVFRKPGDVSKSILILNVNPLAPTLAPAFDPMAVYELKIDNDGDTVADVAFRITFSKLHRGRQTARVRRATGRRAAGRGRGGQTLFHDVPVSFGPDPHVATAGPYKFFAGIRSDPFFFDLMAFLAGFKFHNPGTDFFVDKNVFGMVLEVPGHALGPQPKIGFWCRTLAPTPRALAAGLVDIDEGVGDHRDDQKDDDDRWFQVDRMGRPAINTVFNHGEDKNRFNQIEPSQDRTTRTVDPNPQAGVTFLESFTLTLEALGQTPANALALASFLLPDILTVDLSAPTGYPNGRKLDDDVIDISLNLVTAGKITTDFVGPHADYLSTFPYLGQPH